MIRLSVARLRRRTPNEAAEILNGAELEVCEAEHASLRMSPDDRLHAQCWAKRRRKRIAEVRKALFG